jgi:beta-lactamase class A
MFVPKHSLSRPAYDRSVLHRKRISYGRPQVQKPARSKHGLALAIAVFMLFAGYMSWSKHVAAQTATHRQAQIAAQQKADGFHAQVNQLIAANPQDNLSVVTYSDVDGLRTYGPTSAMDGASTGKLLTAVTYLHQVEQGQASLQTVRDGYSAARWLKVMLVNSDDTAWSELNNAYMSHDELAAYAQDIGFGQYDPGVNTFTAADVARLLQKVYSGNIVSPAHRSLLLGYLAQANYRNYIVAAVPAGDQVYHKAGINGDTLNDAAIIKNGEKYVVLVIFTNGNGNYDLDHRGQLMQAVTRRAIAAYL